MLEPASNETQKNDLPEESNELDEEIEKIISAEEEPVPEQAQVNFRLHSPATSPVLEKNIDNSEPQEQNGTKEKNTKTQRDISSDFIKNETQLNIMTGVHSFQLFEALEKIVSIVSPKTVAASKRINAKLSLKDKIVLTFIKLKHNISYSFIACIFQKVTAQNCRNIFLNMIKILSAGLQFAIYWPSKEEVLKNIPVCFNEFIGVRAVIDVIEMGIQAPKELCCQIATYSAYKGTNTVRYMTAVSPAGLITFKSKPFCGRSSDKSICIKSQFIKLFDKGDGLMTDKGFLIDDECLSHEITLVRPPFLKDRPQFTKEEAILNAKIARARVHIERSNQRIKLFRILSTKIPSYLVPKIDQVFTIACAIVNLSSPILAANKE